MNVAIRCWNMLSNGMGGIDWSGLPFVAGHLGVEDIEALIADLTTIKTHKKPDEDTGET